MLPPGASQQLSKVFSKGGLNAGKTQIEWEVLLILHIVFRKFFIQLFIFITFANAVGPFSRATAEATYYLYLYIKKNRHLNGADRSTIWWPVRDSNPWVYPWKGYELSRFSNGPNGAHYRARTYNRSVNSRLLCHWAKWAQRAKSALTMIITEDSFCKKVLAKMLMNFHKSVKRHSRTS